MEQKIFEEKLSEVCEWIRIPAEKKSVGYVPAAEKQPEGELPTIIKIKEFKPIKCPKFKDKTDCYFQVNWWHYKGKDNAIRMKKCKTCQYVETPKGHWISYKGHRNMLRLVLDYDKDN